MKTIAVYLFLFLFCSSLTAQLVPIGQWREHLDYRSGKRVAATSDRIFVAANFAVYSVAVGDGEITRLSKVSGLHDVGVRTINYQSSTN